MLFEWDMTQPGSGARRKALLEIGARRRIRRANSRIELFEGRRRRSRRRATSSSASSRKTGASNAWPAIDRSILRLAIHELRSATAPPKVVIDEALELAKNFSSADAPAFLNGILDAAFKSLARKSESFSLSSLTKVASRRLRRTRKLFRSGQV